MVYGECGLCQWGDEDGHISSLYQECVLDRNRISIAQCMNRYIQFSVSYDITWNDDITLLNPPLDLTQHQSTHNTNIYSIFITNWPLIIYKMSLRTARLTSLLTRAAARAPSITLRPLLGASGSSVHIPSQSSRQVQPFPLPTSNQVQIRGYAVGATTGKSQADLLVDELQELYSPPSLSPHYPLPQQNGTNTKHRYEVAKDEFEIATDSTDNATIYAASDRESCRDALNQLLATYSLYTSSEIRSTAESHQPQQAQPDDSGMDAVGTGYDPADIEPAVREEVRKRVGQRVRELDNAVGLLEERAQAD